ncbi:MAG: universal stress protein [Brevibacterium aurantiacum]|nr:universal stress protein [Brevibacterium aurantiacum]
MLYIVGYAPNQHGEDAIALASALASTQDTEIKIVHVLNKPAPADASFLEERAVQETRAGYAGKWLSEALRHVGDGVSATAEVVYADSVAEGLMNAARDNDAALIIVSAARNGPLKRFTIGSVANALLHASHVPVALVPSGYERPSRITRMTAAIGSREGADTLLELAVETTARRSVPLRLMSLIALDFEGAADDEFALKAARLHARKVLDEVVASVGTRTDVTAVVAEGSTIEHAVESLPWNEGEIAIIGSSRLAEHRKIFMGSTANKLLRALPIPLVVVPRSLDKTAADPESLSV